MNTLNVTLRQTRLATFTVSCSNEVVRDLLEDAMRDMEETIIDRLSANEDWDDDSTSLEISTSSRY
jgi:hypothetical protein